MARNREVKPPFALFSLRIHVVEDVSTNVRKRQHGVVIGR